MRSTSLPLPLKPADQGPFSGNLFIFESYWTVQLNLSTTSLIPTAISGKVANRLGPQTVQFFYDNQAPKAEIQGRPTEEGFAYFTVVRKLAIAIEGSENEEAGPVSGIRLVRLWLTGAGGLGQPVSWLQVSGADISADFASREAEFLAGTLGVVYECEFDATAILNQLPCIFPPVEDWQALSASVEDRSGNQSGVNTFKLFYNLGKDVLPSGLDFKVFDKAETVFNPDLTWNDDRTCFDVVQGADVRLPYCFTGTRPVGTQAIYTGNWQVVNSQGDSITGGDLMDLTLNNSGVCNFRLLSVGNYRLRLFLEADGATLLKAADFNFRVNAPPEVTLMSPVTAFWGRNLGLDCGAGEANVLKVTNDDNAGSDSWNGDYQVSWTVTSESPVNGPVATGSLDAVTALFPRRFFDGRQVQTDTFTVMAILTDKHGLSVQYRLEGVVSNSQSGQLGGDEVWLGTHSLNGVVTVPPNVTLTIENCTVNAGGAAGIVVANGGSLVISGSSLVATPEVIWLGIRNGGSAILTGSTISRARQALVALPSSTTNLVGCDFEGNQVAVQVIGSIDELRIDGCYFRATAWYVIKEDGVIDTRPQLTNNRISGPGHLYYQASDGQFLDLTAVNDIPGNDENIIEAAAPAGGTP